MSVSKKLCHQDIIESKISPTSLFLIAEDAKRLHEQTPENVQALRQALETGNISELRRLLITEKLVSPNTRIQNIQLLHTVYARDNLDILRVLLDCDTLDINCQNVNFFTILMKEIPFDAFKMIISDPRVDLELYDRKGNYAIEFSNDLEEPYFISHPKQPILRNFGPNLRYRMIKWRTLITLSNCITRRTLIPVDIARVIVLYMLYFQLVDKELLHRIIGSDGTYSIREILWMGGIVTEVGVKQLDAKRKETRYAALRKQFNEFYSGMTDEEKKKYTLK